MHDVEKAATQGARAVVRAAIAPLLAEPDVTATQISQLVLGQGARLLEAHETWRRVEGSDGYDGWVHHGYLVAIDHAAWRKWMDGANQGVVVSRDAQLVQRGGGPVMTAPWGARLGRGERTGVRLPDGREARLAAGEVVPAAELPKRFPARGEAVIASARAFMGAPYLWGGVTPWGVDCSGFVQAVYAMHGVPLPRDSYQQQACGRPVNPEDPSAYQPGDLLFFAERPDRITHVAFATGEQRILHAALTNGGVAENDLAGSLPLERALRSVLHGVRRILD